MATHITNPKSVQRKSRSHQVECLYGHTYRVTSGTSGEKYIVTVRESGATCSCPWGQYRPTADGRRSGCSHVTAVYDHIAAEQGRTVSAWTDPAQVAKQHRPAAAIGDGVILTTRKA